MSGSDSTLPFTSSKAYSTTTATTTISVLDDNIDYMNASASTSTSNSIVVNDIVDTSHHDTLESEHIDIDDSNKVTINIDDVDDDSITTITVDEFLRPIDRNDNRSSLPHQVDSPISSNSSSTGLYINELTLGEKMNLKTRIYDLKKKLNTLELEKSITEEYSFKPEMISRYKLPDRPKNDMFGNLKRAEMMKEQKMALLMQTIKVEEGYTFSPKISTYGKKRSSIGTNGSKPVNATAASSTPTTNSNTIHGCKKVFDRLYEKQEEYGRKDRLRQYHHQNYDTKSGQKLYTPKLLSRQPHSTSSSNSNCNSITMSNDGSSTMAADTYLYQDAIDRVTRCRERSMKNKNSIECKMTSKKINSKSEAYLKQKSDREVRAVYEDITKAIADQNDVVLLATMGYDELQLAVEKLINERNVFAPDKLYSVTDQIWNILDQYKTGCVTYESFLAISTTFAVKNSDTAAWSPNPATDSTVTHSSSSKDANANTTAATIIIDEFNGVIEEARPVASTPNASDVAVFKIFLREMIKHHNTIVKATEIQRQRQEIDDEIRQRTYHPTISDRSKELAKKKESKDKEVLIHLLNDHATDSQRGDSTSAAVDAMSDTSSQSPQGNGVNISYFDLLYGRNLIAKLKLDEKRKHMQRLQDEKCTFKPFLHDYLPPPPPPPPLPDSDTADASTDGVDGDGGGGDGNRLIVDASGTQYPVKKNTTPVHERLYTVREASTACDTQSTKLQRELVECTFRPNIHSSTSSPIKDSNKSVMDIKGTDKAVERMRAVQREKDKVKEEMTYKESKEYIDKCYKKSLQQFEQGLKPFVLSHEHAASAASPKKVPQLYLDVQLAPNRSVRVVINYGDNSAAICDNFAKVHALSEGEHRYIEDAVNKYLASSTSRGNSHQDGTTTGIASGTTSTINDAMNSSTMLTKGGSFNSTIQCNIASVDSSDTMHDDTSYQYNICYDYDDYEPVVYSFKEM